MNYQEISERQRKRLCSSSESTSTVRSACFSRPLLSVEQIVFSLYKEQARTLRNYSGFGCNWNLQPDGV